MFLLDRKLECGPMPNVIVSLPNIGGALCSTPQSSVNLLIWRKGHLAGKKPVPLIVRGSVLEQVEEDPRRGAG